MASPAFVPVYYAANRSTFHPSPVVNNWGALPDHVPRLSYFGYNPYTVPVREPMLMGAHNTFIPNFELRSPMIQYSPTLTSGVYNSNIAWPMVSYFNNYNPHYSFALENAQPQPEVYSDALENVHTPPEDYFAALENVHTPPEAEFRNEYSENQARTGSPISFPEVTSEGTIFMALRKRIQVYMNIDRGVYVKNSVSNCEVCMNSNVNKVCVVHPRGRVFENCGVIFMDSQRFLADFDNTEVSFGSRINRLGYCVNSNGVKTAEKRVNEISDDTPLKIFQEDSNVHLQIQEQQLEELIACTKYRAFNNGGESWTINGVRVRQDQFGNVTISKNYGRRTLYISPNSGCAWVRTPYFYTIVSHNHLRYLYSSKGNISVSMHKNGMAVYNETQRAGVNTDDQLILW